MKIALCGFGVAGAWVLCYLAEKYGVDNIAVYTHKDGRTGKGLVELARELGCWVTTDSINDGYFPFEPDIIASVYYRIIIGQHIIDRVKGKIFNAHTSLLPRHRGRSPLSWAIICGDQYSGVTFHYIDAGIDTGPIIFQKAVELAPTETLVSLFDKINLVVFLYFPAALELVKLGVPGQKQDGKATHNPVGPPYGGVIDPEHMSFGLIERLIRAMTYPPLPYATYNGIEIKSFEDYEALELNHRFSFPGQQR